MLPSRTLERFVLAVVLVVVVVVVVEVVGSAGG